MIGNSAESISYWFYITRYIFHDMFDYKKTGLEVFYAGGFVYNPVDRTILMIFRDGNTKVMPYHWAIWGGLNEPGEEPHECFIREFEEETGIRLPVEDVEYFTEYLVEVLDTYRYTFVVEKELDPHTIRLGEGGGYAFIPISDLDKYQLCPRSKKDIDLFLKTKE